MTFDPALLLLLVPIGLVQVGLMIAALWDLTRPGRRVRGESRLLWGVIIVLVNLIGPIVYFILGREEAGADEATAAPPAPPGPGAIAGWAAPTSASVAPPAAASPARPDGLATATDRPREGPPEATVLPATIDRAPLPGGPPAITTSGLSKRYGNGGTEVLALDALDLEVPAGSIFGLLGPNGAGKTTTLRLLTALGHPTSGTATVGGVAIADGGPELASQIGWLDQEPRFYGWQTGRELVELAGRLHDLDGTDGAERVAEVLAQVGLAGAADRRVSTYSGGMRQRLGIAQAIVHRPPILILDEPVSSLDPEGRRDLLGLIADMRGTTTVLFSTHVLSDVERICDRVAILDRGRLVTEGALDELLDRYARPIYRLDPEPGQEAAIERLTAALRGTEWVTAVDRVHGYLAVTVADPGRAAAELLPAVVAAGLRLATYERVRPTLEDVFLRLTGRGTGEVAA
jgi:ABC-2 type transport system ATP-binding protein